MILRWSSSFKHTEVYAWCSSIDADGGTVEASSSWRVGVLSGAVMWLNSIQRSYIDFSNGSGTQWDNLPHLSNWGTQFHSLYGLQYCSLLLTVILLSSGEPSSADDTGSLASQTSERGLMSSIGWPSSLGRASGLLLLDVKNETESIGSLCLPFPLSCERWDGGLKAYLRRN